jgi:hypothetical protein
MVREYVSLVTPSSLNFLNRPDMPAVGCEAYRLHKVSELHIVLVGAVYNPVLEPQPGR